VPEDRPTFIIFRDVPAGNYRWRLRSARGETLDISQRIHRNKGECEQEVHRIREDRYPGAAVRDLTVGRFEI
jgi:uncharacterized protein YegP (UPF0339 family)